jgi:hypothetical protein
MDRDVTFSGTRRIHRINVIYGETSSMALRAADRVAPSRDPGSSTKTAAQQLNISS